MTDSQATFESVDDMSQQSSQEEVSSDPIDVPRPYGFVTINNFEKTFGKTYKFPKRENEDEYVTRPRFQSERKNDFRAHPKGDKGDRSFWEVHPELKKDGYW